MTKNVENITKTKEIKKKRIRNQSKCNTLNTNWPKVYISKAFQKGGRDMKMSNSRELDRRQTMATLINWINHNDKTKKQQQTNKKLTSSC